MNSFMTAQQIFHSYSIKEKIFAVVAATLSIIFTSSAQNISELFADGISLEKSFKDSLALARFEKVLAVDQNHVEALSHASRMYSNLAGRMNDQNNKRLSAERAKLLAQKAIALYSNHKEAHVNYVVALGLLADVATGSGEKLQHARIIKQEAELLIQLDSLYAPSFFILGKWNLSLARLSWIEKLACDVLFGGVPKGASLQNAIRCFDKAIALQPDYILFHYNRALAYFYTGNYPETRRSLNRAFALPEKEPDDKIRLNQCYALLNETKKMTAN